MSRLMKAYLFVACVMLLSILEMETLLHIDGANLSNWREHRRQKRFILFENAGISKLVTGITFPVDLSDKRPWRQLVLTVNIQYQFPVPSRPIYYWDVWDEDRSMKKKSNNDDTIMPTVSVDEAQLFLYEFAADLLQSNGYQGHSCLQHAICENAQLNGHDGLFAEIVHRILTPHSSSDVMYQDAFKLGREGVDCKTAFPKAANCILNQFLYIREEVLEDDFNFVDRK